MAIFTHVMVGTNDLPKAKAFFGATLAPLGIKNLGDMTDHSTMFGVDGPEFMVTTPADGQPPAMPMAAPSASLRQAAKRCGLFMKPHWQMAAPVKANRAPVRFRRPPMRPISAIPMATNSARSALFPNNPA